MDSEIGGEVRFTGGERVPLVSGDWKKAPSVVVFFLNTGGGVWVKK